MKKIAFVLIISAVAATSSFARGPLKRPSPFMHVYKDETTGLSLGGRVGASLYTLTYSGPATPVTFGFKTSFTAAGIINYAFSDLFSIQPELSFIQKGAEMNFFGEKAGETSNYFEMPILGKLTFGKDFKVFINAGPTLGFAVAASIKDFDGESQSVKFDDTDGRKKFEIGLAAGSGFGFMAGPGMLFVEGRYGMGLTSYVEAKSTNMLTGEEEDSKGKNFGYHFSIGYIIPLE